MNRDRDIAREVSDSLLSSGAMVATAESCTGGLISSKLTDIPGASGFFHSGIVAYSYESQVKQLRVTRESMDEHGSVSEPIARQMARSIRDLTGVTWGISATGIAGPTGGTEDKPVGTAFIGVAYAGEWETQTSYTTVERKSFEGNREQVKEGIAVRALEKLLEEIEELSE